MASWCRTPDFTSRPGAEWTSLCSHVHLQISTVRPGGQAGGGVPRVSIFGDTEHDKVDGVEQLHWRRLRVIAHV